MSQLLAIKERIRTITNLRKVTRAMELVTRTKINRARNSASAARRFQQLFDEVFVMASGSADVEWPMARGASPGTAPTGARRRYVVGFLSQKGFCGGFNDRAIGAIRSLLESDGRAGGARDKAATAPAHTVPEAVETRLILVGRRNSKWTYALNLEFTHFAAPEKTYSDDLGTLGEEISQAILNDEVESVYLVFNELVSILEQRPIALRVFPREDGGDAARPAEREAPAAKPYVLLEPAPDVLMESLIPAYVRACLERAYWETVAGENCSRLLSMKNANDNASKMLDTLHVEYNKTRQTKITQELSEIVSAFDVLKSIQDRRNHGEEET